MYRRNTSNGSSIARCASAPIMIRTAGLQTAAVIAGGGNNTPSRKLQTATTPSTAAIPECFVSGSQCSTTGTPSDSPVIEPLVAVAVIDADVAAAAAYAAAQYHHEQELLQRLQYDEYDRYALDEFNRTLHSFSYRSHHLKYHRDVVAQCGFELGEVRTSRRMLEQKQRQCELAKHTLCAQLKYINEYIRIVEYQQHGFHEMDQRLALQEDKLQRRFEDTRTQYEQYNASFMRDVQMLDADIQMYEVYRYGDVTAAAVEEEEENVVITESDEFL